MAYLVHNGRTEEEMTLTRTPHPTRSWRTPLICLLALIAFIVPGCAQENGPDAEEDFGIPGPFEPDGPLGKEDSAGVPGPLVNTDTRATQVWDAKNQWEDTDTANAKAAGIAWGANSGLNWDQKYALWIQSMERAAGQDTWFETFTMTTPWGKTVPSPKLECAEMAMFLRITFAAWYKLPFYLTSTDSEGTRVYFGHFGARTKTSRYKNTPLFGQSYKDHSNMTAAEIAANGWPQDANLRKKGLYGGGDDMPYIGEGARAGAYFDEIHLNKRVGHFLTLTLAYFGSMHMADSRNTFNLAPEALAAGDVLVERWQRRGIGHTLVVKQVEEITDGLLEAHLVSGSMPRRQPKWETGVASKGYFTNPYTGGEGENSDGDKYAALGGGLKRFRVTKNINGYWTNTWMRADEANWINDTDLTKLAARVGRFESLLGSATPEAMRNALIGIIDDARHHLREYPASCSAREKREDAFAKLYSLNESEFGLSRAETDAEYRTLEDYVFNELEYNKSKTCCWNSSTAAMYQIVMDYNESLMADMCVDPVVFRAENGGYEVFEAYAEATNRGHLWKPWTEDETCAQRDTQNDVVVPTAEVGYCEISDGPPPEGGCVDDDYEDNDSFATAVSIDASGTDLMVCSGDDDFFRVTVPSGETVEVQVSFVHTDGDIDLEILDNNGSSIASSTTVGDVESATLTGPGTFVVHVYGYAGAQASYTLSL
jgi:hypothetical protein